MAATYDSGLTTDKDWVRFLIGDRTVAAAQLQDEEINALLAEEPNKYLAAARALEVMWAGWLAKGQGLAERKIGQLSIRRAENQSAHEAMMARIRELRVKGAADTMSKPRAFRVL